MLQCICSPPKKVMMYENSLSSDSSVQLFCAVLCTSFCASGPACPVLCTLGCVRVELGAAAQLSSVHLRNTGLVRVCCFELIACASSVIVTAGYLKSSLAGSVLYSLCACSYGILCNCSWHQLLGPSCKLLRNWVMFLLLFLQRMGQGGVDQT